jgi:aminoglycoside phosphotransferase (APT) family kinase protein
MATVGDPLADVGYFMNQWAKPIAVPGYEQRQSTIVRLLDAEGFLTPEELAAMYEERSGRSMRDVLFYRALASYKLIVILEGLYMHYVEGSASNPASAEFEWRVPMMVDQLRMLLASEGHNV